METESVTGSERKVGVSPSFIVGLPRLFAGWLIVVYQRAISPWLPVSCRYYPSCSQYSLTAIHRHGLLWGVALTCWRLLRCNPFTRGGVDDVPETTPWQTPRVPSV